MLSLSLSSTLLLSFLSVCNAAPSSNPPTLTRRDAPPAPLSTACGDVVRNASENSFPAKLVYECLTSVPFHAAVSTKFLKYYADSLQFQSTLEFLKAPPAGYQQPATDLLGNIAQIQALIDTNQFKNQYEFEAALQSAIYATHDDHLSLSAGILGVFTFGTRYRIVSLSEDGIALPKLYLSADIILGSQDGDFVPSPIVKLDKIEAVKYLTAFAAKNAVGGIESHTDWNSLMINPAQVIQGHPSIWGGAATFYPGETLTIELANGTVITTPWWADFHGDSETGPLETGGDFYNSFVLGFLPASFESTADENDNAEEATSTIIQRAATSTSAKPTKSATATPRPEKWGNSAYPTPDLAQRDLGEPGGGWLSGYFLKGSIAVLSVPSFQVSDAGIDEYSDFVDKFIKTSKAKGMKKIIIDLQRNFGGDALLATDMFKHFFPGDDKQPYGGSRLRGHRAANIIGKTLTEYWNTTSATDVEQDEDDTDYYYLYSNEWIAPTRINADTNETFKSWEEFYGPHPAKGADFTTPQRYPFADTLFDTAASGSDESFVVYGYGSRPADKKQEYAAENIIILTDGHCASTCSIFVEMMHYEAGVRTIVAGGRPEYGPMQAVGLARGAVSYPISQIDSDIEDTKSLLDFFNQTNDLLPGRSEGLDVEVYHASVNLRDQVRKDDPVPLQFKYDAATCRIFYTPSTVYNFTALWHHAASAMWTTGSNLCVEDSTGYSTTDSKSNKLPPNNIIPASSALEIPEFHISEAALSIIGMGSGIQADRKPAGTTADNKDKKAKEAVSYVGQDCSGDKGDSSLCPTNYFCDDYYVACDGKTKNPYPGCVLMCNRSKIGALCADAESECRSRPGWALTWDVVQTGRGYCSTPLKNDDVKCKNKKKKSSVTPTTGYDPGMSKRRSGF